MSATRNLLVLALFGVAAAAMATSAGAADDLTPLGKWMKPNLGTPMASGDLATVAKNLEVVASKPPPGAYGEWAGIARAGAESARGGDTKGTKASCKSCHDKYKEKYKVEHKTRPFP